jgi:ribosomal protein S18 acetylase RimI-like enzyme
MRAQVIGLAKRLLRRLLGDYGIYYVLTRACDQLEPVPAGTAVVPVDAAMVRASPDPDLRGQSFYAGADALGYGYIENGALASLCFYWYGERYKTRNFWPLQEGEIKLVEIVTAAAMRGRKLAPTLINASLHDVARRGFRRAYARVWHSNTSSLRAFEAAGWERIALVIEIFPFGRATPMRWKKRL